MKKLLALLLALVMLLTLAACGEDEEEGGRLGDKLNQQPQDTIPQDTTAPVPVGTTLTTPLWTLVYDEDAGWVNQEDDFSDSDTYSRAILIIPGEEGEELINIEIRVTIDEPYGFRDYMVSYGFDQYEYAVNNAYDFVNVGGVDCLMQEGNYWGEPCLRYFNRVEGAGATVFIEIIGEYEDERVAELLSGLTISLPMWAMWTAPGTGTVNPSPPAMPVFWSAPIRWMFSGSPLPSPSLPTRPLNTLWRW